MNYPPMIIEALNTWQLFRQMGYPPESIWLELPVLETEPGRVQILVGVRHLDKSASIRIGKAEAADDNEVDAVRRAVQDTWERAGEEYRGLSNDVRMDLFNKSKARRCAVDIIAKLLAAGLGTTPEQIEARQ